MNKISQRVEEIFSQAVGLDQAGRMRNTIYALDDTIYILNFDHTVLLRFRLRKSETPFKSPVSFRANDYDSRQFYEEDGKIVFVSEGGGFTRKKSCASPGDTPEQIEELFESFPIIEGNLLRLHRDVLSVLDDALSHIEFSAVDGSPILVQRNIYSGAVIELTRSDASEGLGLGAEVQDQIDTDFGPVGMRTNDFMALFSFLDSLSFYFPEGESDYCYVKSDSPRLVMDGFISHCVYDELGGITESRKENKDGREKQKERGREQGTDRQTESQPRRSRRK